MAIRSRFQIVTDLFTAPWVRETVHSNAFVNSVSASVKKSGGMFGGRTYSVTLTGVQPAVNRTYRSIASEMATMGAHIIR